MKIVLLGAILLLAIDAIFARPAVKDIDETTRLAAEYAARHPNKEIGIGEECEELVAEGKEPPTVSEPLNAVIDPELLWPNNTLYYQIDTAGYTPDQITLIEAGIADLLKLTQVNGENCINILPNTVPSRTDYVSVENYSGCSSYVGRIGGQQRLSLVNSCVNVHGTIMHEFLHAFGFHHEHKRTDRDSYVVINWVNIQPDKVNNFVKLDETQIDLLGTSYDYGSVMHYSAYGFAIDPSVPTIIPLDPSAEIGQRVTLSALDIERVQILYGCLSPANSIYFKHLA
jgi:hypothetical protein